MGDEDSYNRTTFAFGPNGEMLAGRLVRPA